MPAKKHSFHDGKLGAALAVRVTPRSRMNQVADILDNGTVRIRLTAFGEDSVVNEALLHYLSEILQIPTAKLDIVAGLSGHDKLVSILDMDVESVHRRILEVLK